MTSPRSPCCFARPTPKDHHDRVELLRRAPPVDAQPCRIIFPPPTRDHPALHPLRSRAHNSLHGRSPSTRMCSGRPSPPCQEPHRHKIAPPLLLSPPCTASCAPHPPRPEGCQSNRWDPQSHFHLHYSPLSVTLFPPITSRSATPTDNHVPQSRATVHLSSSRRPIHQSSTAVHAIPSIPLAHSRATLFRTTVHHPAFYSPLPPPHRIRAAIHRRLNADHCIPHPLKLKL